MPLQIRRGTNAERTAMTQPLAAGELLYVTDTQRIYVGTGATLGGLAVTGYTDNEAKDAAATIFTGGSHSGVSFAYNTVDNTMSATVDLSAYSGSINVAAVKGSVFADDSTLLVDGVSGRIVGPVFANVTGNVTGNLTGNVTGDVTGNVVGNTTGYHTGDVKGSVVADDSTILVDSVAGRIVGPVFANVTGNVTGNVNGNLTGNVSGALTGNVTGNLTGTVYGDTIGYHTGDVKGSIVADDSSILVDSVTGLIVGDVVTSNLTVTNNIDFISSIDRQVNHYGPTNGADAYAGFSANGFRGSYESPSTVQNGDLIAKYTWEAWNGTAYVKAATASSQVTSVPAGGNFNSALSFSVLTSTGSYRTFVMDGTTGAFSTVAIALTPLTNIQISSVTPAEGVIAYNTDVNALQVYNGSAFVSVPTIVSAPTAANDPGLVGQIAYDSTHIYICIATNSWIRSTAAAW